MKKVLMVASVASTIKQFNMGNIRILQKLGYQVEVACNFSDKNPFSKDAIADLKSTLELINVTYHQVDFARSPYNLTLLLRSYRAMRHLLAGTQFSFIHCHTPVASFISRIAAHQTNTRVIYTAHGFHFYRGAPLLNWLIYFPLEKLLSRYTDMLITINDEDFKTASNRLHAKQVKKLPGVGVDITRFARSAQDKPLIRHKLGIPEHATVLVSVGELNDNKNHGIILQAIAKMSAEYSLIYVICGKGPAEAQLRKTADSLGITGSLMLLGYCDNVSDVLAASDIFVLPSRREGLPVSVIEAMAAGLPVVCSSIRGNIDLVINDKGGFVCHQDPNVYAEKLGHLLDDSQLRHKMGSFNKLQAEQYCAANIDKEMLGIYSALIS